MFKKVDRILVAVKDLDQAQRNYQNILGASVIEDFESTYLNAKVRKMAIGASEVELCCPKGPGITQERIDKKGEGLFIGGVETDDLKKFEQHLKGASVSYEIEDDRIFPEQSSLYDLPLVVSQTESRKRAAGPVEFLYELTMVLKTNWQTVAQRYADAFGLNRDHEVDIAFKRFGYEGTLMKFDPSELDRIELSEATDVNYPMGRYTAKHGDSLYMCYIQTDNLADIIERLKRNNGGFTRRTDTPVERDGLWIHPAALNGVLLGVSRTSLAWGWSGNAERVQPLSD